MGNGDMEEKFFWDICENECTPSVLGTCFTNTIYSLLALQ